MRRLTILHILITSATSYAADSPKMPPSNLQNLRQAQEVQDIDQNYIQKTAKQAAQASLKLAQPHLTQKEQQKYKKRLQELEADYPEAKKIYKNNSYYNTHKSLLRLITQKAINARPGNLQLNKAFHQIMKLKKAQQALQKELEDFRQKKNPTKSDKNELIKKRYTIERLLQKTE